jgi:TonB-linked SusC/RagA family outer membrane protein
MKGKLLSFVAPFYGKGSTRVLLLLIPLLITGSVIAQTTITGTVKNAKGTPLPGVSIVVKGTQQGTHTDDKGAWSIAVPSTASVLVFSSVGFVANEMKVGNRTQIDVTMIEKNSDLDDVIVIGYGQAVKKRDGTGAISTVSDKQIAERQPINLVDAIQGYAAGVYITNDAGEPGAEGTIRIRGNGTFSGGNGPLYVIDGVLRDDATNLNPNDIQSIEVLKDAASASIYGSRSANGVIIITTKRGADGKAQIGVRLSRVAGKISHKLDQPNAEDVRLYKRLSGETAIPTDSLNPAYNSDNDNIDILTQTAIRDQVDFTASGGSKNITYYSSLMYRNEQGLIINSWNKVVNARINIDYKPSARFKYGNQLIFGFKKNNNINEGRTITEALRRPANFAYFLPDGNFTGFVSGRPNTLAWLLFNKNETETYNASMYNYINYNVTKDLLFTTNLNVELVAPHNVSFTPKILSNNNPATNLGSESFDQKFNWAYQAFLNYNKTIAGDHTITAMAGFSAERTTLRTSDIGSLNYVNENIFTSNSGTLDPSKTRTDGEANSLASFFGRAGYNYKGRYIVTATLRRDGSSRFGKQNRWGYFPAASAAWRVSDEKFMIWSAAWVSDLKLRASYGVLGRENIPNYANLQRYTFGSNFYNGESGVVLTNSFGNNYLAWENAEQFNGGIDLGLLNGRISITADYYQKTTRDLLYERPLPVETGFANAQVNVGSIKNKGVEFAVNATPYRTKDFEWTAGFNIAFENSRILELNNHEPFVAGDKWMVAEGGMVGDFYIYRALGVYAYNESNAWDENWEQLTPNFGASGAFIGYTSADGKTYNGKINRTYANGILQKGGDVIYDNISKDSVIDASDRMIAGNAQPKFYGGFINNIRYKRFTLSFLFTYTWGNKIYNDMARALDDMGTSTIVPRKVQLYNSWKQPGDITMYPAVANKKGPNFLASTRYLEDGSYIRLASARLTYDLNKKWAAKAKMQGAQLYVFGTNLLTWTKYTGWDPEFSSGNILQPGQDGGKYPKRREIGVGLNVNF